MRVTMKDVKDFAFRQMDGMWHDGSGLTTTNMVKFIFKKYVVVNPWMDETTQRKVNPYKYYGKKRTKTLHQESGQGHPEGQRNRKTDTGGRK